MNWGRLIVKLLLGLLVLGITAHPAAADVIYYPSITNDSVFYWAIPPTVGAYDFGFNGPLTVHGVNFADGNSLLGNDGMFATGAGVSPTDFQTMMSTGDYRFDAPMDFTLNGLTPGTDYHIQLFFANNGVARSFNVSVEGTNLFGSSILLGSNGAAGLLTDYIATDSTLNLSLIPDPGNYVVLSGITVSTVPEPGMYGMLAGVAALTCVVLSRRKTQLKTV